MTRSEDELGAWERNLRERMVVFREAKNLTQTDLARNLRSRYKLPFHQQTIQRIESGERPIRLNEAYLIAQELGADLFQLTEAPTTAGAVMFQFGHASARLTEVAEEVAEKVGEYQPTLERLYQDVEDAFMNYEATQHDAGGEVDPNISAEMRRIKSRFERAMQGLALIDELGDF